MKLLMRCNFGSHLYGTNTENSDTDYKGVYLPNLENCILGNVKRSIVNNSKGSSAIKNSKDDFDSEIYSLQYFLLELGKNGDTTFLDMIHAPDSSLIETSEAWEFLRKNRNKFYTKSLKSYIGYCRSQAAKYGIRGSKLEEAKKLLAVLNSHDDGQKLAEYFDELPNSEYSKRYTIEKCDAKDNRTFDFCGKKLMANSNTFFAKQTIQHFYDGYGTRAKQAELNQGIDWKAISHAFRVGYQLKELYTTGDLIFPLKDAKFLIDLKRGKFHYKNDGIAEKLENIVDEVQNLAELSNYHEKVDVSFCEEFILELYKK